MNQNQFEEVTLALLDEAKEMLRVKNADYAGECKDRLNGFKSDPDIDPLTTWRVLFNKHLSAIRTYLNTGSVTSEPIHGRILDAIVYLVLLDALIVDSQGEKSDGESQGDAAEQTEIEYIKSGQTDRM